MKCLRCQHENLATAKFCEECAGRLTPGCPNCGSQVSATAKFCPECAHPLKLVAGEPRFASPKDYTPQHLADRILAAKPSIEGERKHVTVLFADIEGSTGLIADRDPEEAQKLIDPVVERMIEAVHHYEGTVNRVLGDGIMALFGAPLAHEDHAVRACHAALRMQETVKQYAEISKRSHGLSITIRVGLNSGEIVVCDISNDLHTNYTVVGQTVHLAARMEQMANPGSVLATANTFQLAEGYVGVKPLGLVPVKGLTNRVNVYEVTEAGPARNRLQAAALRGLTRFVGRDAELDQLRSALQLAAAGHGQVVAIIGEAGVGKSRLLREFTHSHHLLGWRVLESASVSYGKGISYLPVIDLLRGYFAIVDCDSPQTVREKLTAKLSTASSGQEGSLPALLSLLNVPVDDALWEKLDPPQRRQRTLDAVKRLLLRESQRQPLLVVFEDLHWIDSETQVLLDVLVESLPAARLLLIVNCRPEYQHPWASRTYYTRLRLDPLPSETAEELLGALLGSDASLQPLKHTLIARTEGNPFFLEESVQSLVETGALLGERGAYRLARPELTIKVPATVQAVIAARVDRLSAVDKMVLQTASVLGKYVPIGLLQAISDVARDELHAAIGRLQTAEFLYAFGFLPDSDYTFKHALTHEVVYGGLLQDRRRALHLRIVQTIERIYPDRLPEHVDRLAHHAFVGEDWAKAVTYLQQAGAKAFARSVHREAVRCFEKALTALTRLPETRETLEQAIDLRFDLRNALLPLVEWERIGGYLREAEALARNLNDQGRLASVSGYMSGLYLNTSARASDVRACVEELEAIGASLHDVVPQLVGRYYRIWLGNLSGDYCETERLCRTLIHALPGDQSRRRLGLVAYPAVVARAFLARALAELGVFDEGRSHGQEAIRLAEDLDHPFSLIWACVNLGRLEYLRGDFSRAIKPLARAVALTQEWDITYLTPMALAALGHAYARSGRIEEGVSWLQQALAGYASAGIGYLHSMSTVQLGEAHLLAGRVDEAWEFGTRAVVLARERGERGHEAWAHLLLGDAASHRNSPDVAAAEAHYATSTALASELRMRPLVAHCRFSVGKLHLRAGDCRAKEHLTAAMNLFREMEMRFWLEKSEAEMQALEVALPTTNANSLSGR